MERKLATLLRWIRETAEVAHGLLIPISGGSDSALCFWLCNQAYSDRTLGIFFGDRLRCSAWFEGQGRFEVMPPPEGVSSRQRELQRWAILLDRGLMEMRWLVGSRNRTEEVFGTYSLASRLATFLPLAGLWKSEVMDLCEFVGIPREITESSRKADPDCGRSRELSEVPLEKIDLFLKVKTGELSQVALSALTPDQIRYLNGIYHYNQFKKTLPMRGPV